MKPILLRSSKRRARSFHLLSTWRGSDRPSFGSLIADDHRRVSNPGSLYEDIRRLGLFYFTQEADAYFRRFELESLGNSGRHIAESPADA